MKYIVGFDGGGTKTRCVIANSDGDIIADCLGGPSNHQTIGKEATIEVLSSLFNKSLETAKLSEADLSFAFLGLAGADLPEDFELLDAVCHQVFESVPFEIVNDTWIIMRSGIKESWGAVSICGTGSNAAAVHPNGEKTILRALGYTLGGFGGGGDMAIEALHHAFRSDEQTGPYSKLEQALPELLEVKDMAELVTRLYPEDNISFEEYRKIPPLVFRLAEEGDEVSRKILVNMGKIQGQMVAGLINKLEMNDLPVPVVLGGSIFNGTCSLFINALEEEIKSIAKDAYLVKSENQPVLGAVLSAFDHITCDIGDETLDRFKQQLNR